MKHFRIHFKIFVLTFKALNRDAPAYISDLLEQQLMNTGLMVTFNSSFNSMNSSSIIINSINVKHLLNYLFINLFPILINSCHIQLIT